MFSNLKCIGEFQSAYLVEVVVESKKDNTKKRKRNAKSNNKSVKGKGNNKNLTIELQWWDEAMRQEKEKARNRATTTNQSKVILFSIYLK